MFTGYVPGRIRLTSKFFHVGDDIYCFLPTGYYNKPSYLVRVKLSGNLDPDFPYSTLETPDPVTYTATGKYRITLIVDDGMHSEASVCKEIVVVPQLEHKPTKIISICQGETVKLGSSSNVGSYRWNNGSSSDSIDINMPGIYWVETNRFNCSNRDSFNVVLKNSALDLGKDTSVCFVNNLILDAGVNNASYLWNTGNTSRTISINAPGKYYVTINQNACDFSDTIRVDLHKKPDMTISRSTTICYNGAARLSATGGSRYKWYPSESLSDPDIENPIATPGRDTRYYVIITDNNQCEYLDSTDVFIHVSPLFSVDTPQPVCEKDSVQLIASGGDSYAWEPTIGLNNDAIDNPRASPASTTEYRVTITDAMCGETATLFTKVMVIPSPKVSAGKMNDIDCSHDQSQLTATGALRYSWIPATSLNDGNIHNPIAKPTIATEYIVEGEDGKGCKGYDTILVKVDNVGKVVYEMPNAFTPDNDGLNDCFGIKYWGVINELEFSIYNRGGERVFFTKNVGQCWDGTYKGVKQESGAFVYMIRAKTICDIDVVRKGTFVLVR